VTARLPEPPSAQDRAAVDALRGALAAAEFTVERVEAALGAGELSTRPADVAVHELRLSGDDAFATLARFFLLGSTVDETRLEQVLAPIGARELQSLRLAERADGGLRATARLVPHGDYYLASDLAGASLAGAAPDWVPGVQAPSVTLAKLAVRVPVSRALDLGTGCGIQALLAAKHSEHVVATDLNPRALEFAAFNAALNDVSTIEFREGDLFEPVQGERFGLVVANPPYVISPDSLYRYRDSGLPGDEICRRVVRGMPTHLEEGGFAHVLVSWAHDAEAGWPEPLHAWVEDGGCDAWLLHYKSEDPVTHAASWLGSLADRDDTSYRATLDRWVAYLREQRIEAIGYGAIVLRRRDGADNWIRTDEIPLDRLESAGEHTLRVFAAADLLAEVAAGLLDERIVLVDEHRIEQALVVRDGSFVVEGQTLELSDGLRFRAGLDRYAAALVCALGTPRPLRETLASAAAELRLSGEDRARFDDAALEVVRRLLELGFLVRAS
jgi:methylase of polypeptide subunit release factors